MEYLDYLPDVFRESRVFQQIGESLWPDVAALREQAAGLPEEGIAQTASQEGIARFETMLGISPRPDDSLEQRRLRVLLALMRVPPFSLGWLRQRLEQTFGAQGFLVEDSPEEHWLRVGIRPFSEEDPAMLWTELRQLIPANLELKMSGLYQSETAAFAGARLQNAVFYRMEAENGSV